MQAQQRGRPADPGRMAPADCRPRLSRPLARDDALYARMAGRGADPGLLARHARHLCRAAMPTPLKLDAYRLMRAAGAMNSERDFIELYRGRQRRARLRRGAGGARGRAAPQSDHRRMPAYARERLALADAPRRRRPRLAGGEPAGRRSPAASRRRARAWATLITAMANMRPAAELYRAALQKGGRMPAPVNIRLGAALALAGQRRRGRGGVPRRHRPARRARPALAALAVDAASRLGVSGQRPDLRRRRIRRFRMAWPAG